MKFLGAFIFIFITFSHLVFAQSDFQLIKEQNPEASNREILKIFYNGSVQAAEINDFDNGDDANSNQECRMVFHSTQDNLNSVVIRKLSKTTPGNGPLFPSKREDKLFMVGVSSLIDGRLSARAIETFDYISMDENAYDLTATMRKNSIHSNSPFKLIMRKNGDLIAFKLLTYKGNIDNGPLFESGVNEDFGYCWRN